MKMVLAFVNKRQSGLQIVPVFVKRGFVDLIPFRVIDHGIADRKFDEKTNRLGLVDCERKVFFCIDRNAFHTSLRHYPPTNPAKHVISPTRDKPAALWLVSREDRAGSAPRTNAVRSRLPYRIDIPSPPASAFDILVELGALDIEAVGEGLAAILPDSIAPEILAAQLGSAALTVSPANSYDDGSVWLLSPRTLLAGGLRLNPAASAFGTGHHPTTALCLEALEEIIRLDRPNSILDVGTGSGILALTALMLGVPRATALDIDAGALKVAAGNAQLNQLPNRIELVLGGPDQLKGNWPLVVANILAAPLIEMAPLLVQRLSTRGWLILSGIHSSLETEVSRAYRHLGIRGLHSKTRTGWTVLTAQAPW